jgi:hypothetical protein
MLKAYEPSGKVYFEEQQHFPRRVIWMVRALLFLIVVGLAVTLFLEKEKEDVVIAIAIVLPTFAIVIYSTTVSRLEKVVTSNGLYFRWRPWQRRFRVIEGEVIGSIVARKFPLMKHGSGRFPGYGRYHNAGSGDGVQLILKNHRKYFFSASDKVSFETALQHLISSDR